MSFNWQTEEEVEASKPAADVSQTSRGPRLFVLLLLVGAVLVLLWLLNRQARVGTQQIESDLLASYVVMMDAARQDDAELFIYFLSGRDALWVSAWERVVAEGAYHERPSLGLTWLPADDPAAAVTQITFNPQYDAAELVAEQTYSYDIGRGLTETVRLQQTAVFRRGRDRWLFSPPDETFWGPEQTVTGAHLSVQVSERDLTIARRLMTDLDEVLTAVCANPLFDCPPDFNLDVSLETDPVVLSPNYKSMVYVAGRWSVRLPTPSLIGLPQDEAGYQALRRGYGVLLVNPVLRQLNGMHASMHMPFLDAWFDWQLRALGLRPYPLGPADWQELAQQAAPLSAGRELFSVNGPATPYSYAVIEFLFVEMGVTPEAFIQSFTGGLIGPYEQWLVGLTGGQLSFADLEARWQAFVQAQANATQRQ